MLGFVVFSIGCSYPEFPDNCIGLKLAILENIRDMLIDGANILLKQFSHAFLGKPDGFALKPDIDF